MNGLRAVVFGSTGAVGSEVIRQALNEPRIAEVTAFTRRPLGFEHDRLTEVTVEDFLHLDPIGDRLVGQDVCFYCLGVSQLQVSDPERYREITYSYTMEAARLLRDRSPELHFHFLSGAGADPGGTARAMFARVKGEAEKDLRLMGLRRLTIWRPGYIHPVVPRSGNIPAFEWLARPLYPIIRRMLPGMATDTVELAHAMLGATFDPVDEDVLDNRRLKVLAARYRINEG